MEIAYWKVWSGWVGNHDNRIEGATCSNCGNVHPTICHAHSVNELSPYCAKCGRVMKVREK